MPIERRERGRLWEFARSLSDRGYFLLNRTHQTKFHLEPSQQRQDDDIIIDDTQRFGMQYQPGSHEREEELRRVSTANILGRRR